MKASKTIRITLLITGLFWLAGAGWCLFSGPPLAWLVSGDTARFNRLQPYWDLAFVTLVSGAILWFLRTIFARWQVESDKLAEMTKRLEEERNVLRAFLNALPDPAFTKDAEGRYVNANQAAVALLKVDDETDMIGRTVDDFYPPSLSAVYREDDLRVLRSGEALLNVERPGRDTNGETRWFLTSRIPLRDGAGKVTGLVGISRDITERKQSEERLRQSEAALRALVDALPEPAFLLDAKGLILIANEALAASLGRPHAALLGAPILQFLPPPVAERRGALMRQVLSSGQGLTFEDVNGERHFVTRLSPVPGPDGSVIGLAVFALDLTERNRAEQTIRQSEATLAALFAGIGDGILVADTETRRFVRANDAICRMLGYSPEEICRLRVEEIHPPEALPQVLAEFALQASGKKALAANLPVLCKDGSIFFADITAQRLELDGRLCAVGVFRDITERKRIEADLHHQREELQLILDSVPALIFYKDRQHRLIRVNQETIRVSGLSREQIEGRNDQEMGHQFAPQYCADEDEVMTTGRPKRGIIEQLETAAGLRWMQTDKLPYRNAAGEIVGIVGFAVDITEKLQAEQERNRLEAQFRQAQKMEAIGTLAGGIAHDFNNILGAIIGYTELARLQTAQDPVVQGYLGAVLEGSQRATALVRQILAFSRRQAQPRTAVQLHGIVAESLKLLRATIPSTIRIDTALENDLPPVLADATQVHQVIMNLCTNAWQAMEGRPGRLGVRLERTVATAALAVAHPQLRRGEHYVCLSVSDTGHGMDPATMERIFEPFFTTKPPGKGTGLGLSVVHGIMQGHQGAVTVESHPREGSVFRLYFPVHESPAEETPSRPASPAPGQGEHVLLVDDEPALVQLGRAMLEKLGYTATVTTSANAALELMRARPEAYDLVITDQTMPGLTGTELARKVTALRPGLPVILTSGYAGQAAAPDFAAAGIRELLLKPHTLQTLGAAVQRALAGKPHA